MRTRRRLPWVLVCLLGCAQDEAKDVAHTLFVAHAAELVAYDVVSGQPRTAPIASLTLPAAAQVSDEGLLVLHSTDSHEVLMVDAETLTVLERVPSSSMGGMRPNDGYICPAHGGQHHWLTLNDGLPDPATNTARFFDLTPDSPTYRKAVGEIALGLGHHQAAFAANRQRVVISSFNDCSNVLSVYDWSDPASIQTVLTIDAAMAGFDGSTFGTTCDPAFVEGVSPSPHGCATTALTGTTYCNVTGIGNIVSVKTDADPISFSVLDASGTGGGFTRATHDGRYVYTVQAKPREGMMNGNGLPCQVGQLVTIDAMADQIVHTLPLFYDGPGCTRSLVGTDEETANTGHMELSHDGRTLFLTQNGGFMVADARVRAELVVDVTDPAEPVQLPSIPTGVGTNHRGEALTGDGKSLFVANNVDGTVTEIDVATRQVVRTLTVGATPLWLATYGTAEGPSTQHGPLPHH